MAARSMNIVGDGVKTTSRGLNNEGNPYKILVVDDSSFVQRQMRQILISEGFDVFAVASNGLEAVAKYKEYKNDIDLVTMDITMPELTGVEALSQILEFDPKAKVVMVSALGKEDIVKQSLVLGAKSYIVKPLEREKVISRIASILST